MSLPPSGIRPLALFSAVSGESGAILLETQRPDVRDRFSYLFRAPRRVIVARRLDEVGDAVEEAGAWQARGLAVAGYVAYEAGYALDDAFRSLRDVLPEDGGPLPLLWMGVYDGALRFDHLRNRWAALGRLVPPFPSPAGRRDETGPPAEPDIPRFSMAEEEHAAGVGAIRRSIARGDVYQANFTGKFLFRADEDPFALYRRLRAVQPVPYGAFLRMDEGCIVSQSPELFFRVRGGRIEARPMKGTAARGLTDGEDRRAAAALASDPKNRAENVMIVDLIRNDLGKVCEAGSVRASRLFEVQRFRTVLQMVSTVRGTVGRGHAFPSILRALFPCGSVTGAPKVAAMRLLRALEPAPRGVYTGAIGALLPGGDMAFSVAIRTVTVQGGRAEAGAGGGIVWDSDAGGEFREVLAKGRYLLGGPGRFDLVETFLFTPGAGFRHLDAHMRRLAASARYFGFRFRRAAVLSSLEAAVRERAGDAAQRVRLLLSRDGSVAVELGAAPPADTAGRGWKVAVSPVAVSSRDPFVRHKTTARAWRDAERARVREEGFDEVLFLNERGELTEGAVTNIFLEIGGRLVTPLLSCGLLGGVMRARLLADRSLGASERVLFPEDLARAGRVLLTNSLRGVLPAVAAFPRPAPPA